MKQEFSDIIVKVNEIAHEDVQKLHEAEKSYGNSWKQRGGVGAFMMLARKWDRIENQTQRESMIYFKLSVSIVEKKV